MKGKGHEFSDVARLLNFYQLWLDGLYPRAKFADGLQLIEKVGHSKRMQVMRKEWIDEGKPGYIKPGSLVDSILNDDFSTREQTGVDGQLAQPPTRDEPRAEEGGMFFPSPSKPGQQVNTGGDEPDDDELDALLAAQETTKPANIEHISSNNAPEDDDDLDALLAEQDTLHNPEPPPASRQPVNDDDDDLDALLAEQEARRTSTRPQLQPQTSPQPQKQDLASKPKPKQRIFGDSDSEESEDDLDALLAEQDAYKSTPPTSPAVVSSEPVGATDKGHAKEIPPEVQSQDSAAKVYSSSPIRNDSPTKEALMTKTYSSSPLPNNPEEEDDLDALLAESGM